MALVYFFEYYDTENVFHRCEIAQNPDAIINLIVNGDFDDASEGWTLGSGWALNTFDNYAQFFGGGINLGSLSQTEHVFESGKTYEVTYTIDSLTGSPNEFRFVFEGVGDTFGQWRTGSIGGTTHTELITLTEDAPTFRIDPFNNNTDGRILNVVVGLAPPDVQTKEIQGRSILHYAQTDQRLEPLRGNGLTVQLEASEDLTFDDLYSEQERTFTVVHYRDGEIIFNGYLNPEGLFEDFVRDRWVISLECIDGLGYLNNISYLSDDGEILGGKQNALNIIAQCLRLTGLVQNININIDIYYDGLGETLDAMANVFLQQSRFVKDDFDTIMSCEQVLRDILDLFRGCVVSEGGEWWIYKPNQLYLNQSPTFFRYDANAVPLGPATVTKPVNFTLGSQVNGFYPHHCNANQRKENLASVGGLRISYKYGITDSVLENISLINIGGVIADWNIIDPVPLTLPASGEGGVSITSMNVFGNINVVLESIPVTVPNNFFSAISFIVTANSHSPADFRFQVRIQEDNPPNQFYYLDNAGQWQYNDPTHYIDGVEYARPSQRRIISTVEVPATPDDTDNMSILILQPFKSGTPTIEFGIESIRWTPLTVSGQTTPTGETHTFQRLNRPSSKITALKEVFNGDNPAATFVGTIFKADEVTPTETWHRKGFAVEDTDKPLLQIMGEEKMRMAQIPSTVFSGDIYGFIPYLSVVTIEGVTGLFMFSSYSYDTKANITSGELIRINGDELTDLDYYSIVTTQDAEQTTLKGF